MNKFFTVIIPLYKSTRLEHALDSIEKQKNKEDVEVILISDYDGEYERYSDILKNYSFDYKLLETKSNLGPGGARQVGLDIAVGEWVTFLDHDDEFTSNAFEIVKKVILETDCEFILSSRQLVGNDYNWINENHEVNQGDGTLHGQFFNLSKLREYNIKFSSTLRTQEDTFFLSLVESYLFLNRDKYIENKTEVIIPNITYIWYLWKDSTSHKDNNTNGSFSYLEKNFNDYIKACYNSVLIASMDYPEDKFFLATRFTNLLIYCYWFMEYFYELDKREANKHKENIKQNILHLKELKNNICNILGIYKNEDLIKLIRNFPEMFGKSYSKLTESNFQEYIIPYHDIKTFYTEII